MIASSILLWVFLIDAAITAAEGMILFGGLLGFLLYSHLQARNDEKEINKLTERAKKSGAKNSNMITLRYRYQIQAVDAITDKTKIQMFIRNMPARDSRALRAHIDDIEPGIEMKNWMECPMCGEESEVRMPLGASFFWPDAE